MGFGPFDSELFPLVVVLTQFSPDAVDAAAKYDDVLREPILADGDADGVGEKPSELQSAEIKVKGQLEASSLEALSMASGGNLPESSVLVNFSRSRLISQSLMRSDGRPKIKPGDRMVRIEEEDGTVLWTFDRPPGGLYCQQMRILDASLGGTMNWYQATFSSRKGKQGPVL